MDSKIDEYVLKYMKISEDKKKVTQTEIDFALKIKEEFEEALKVRIERVYIFKQCMWSEKDPLLCFLVDTKIKNLNSVIAKEFSRKNDVNILFWTACQFEKRKNNPTELDYYIENYGEKIFDTGRPIYIEEEVKATTYAARTDVFRNYFRYIENNPEQYMISLLEIYALKINYPALKINELENLIEYVKHISNDEKILNYINEFNDEKSNKLKICEELKKYIDTIKQIKPQMKLSLKPTMKVYDMLLDIKNNTGKVNISNLDRDNLYIMKVIEEKMDFEIANLFDLPEKEIQNKLKCFGIRSMDTIWYDSIGNIIANAVELDFDETYDALKMAKLLNFEKHVYDILEYMRDGEKYLLRELWPLTNGEREGMELHKAKTAKDVYFRAYLCAEMLKQNGFIEEIDYLTYKITKQGRLLLERAGYERIKELGLREIAEINGEVNFYALSILRLNNGELVYCANTDELEKYEGQDSELIEEIQMLESKEVLEVDFEDISNKKKMSNNNRKSKTRKVDYIKINKSKEKVGFDSEELVYNLEKKKLIENNEENLANEVIWESKENGDGAGYDIKSFEKINGKYVEIYIEVKGTNKGINEPFDISKNEIDASNKYKERYYIYRISNIYSNNPKLYKINGRIEENFELEATSYKARKK